MYGWLGAASFFFELGTQFEQPCDTFSQIIREVFPAFLYAAKVAKQPYTAPKGPDVMCTTLSSTRRNGATYININLDVSDNSRTAHDDDGGTLFATGRQNVRRVEAFLNCHPFVSSCRPVAVRNRLNGRTTSVSLEFEAPARSNNVVYLRATDSSGNTGPITAREF